MKDKKQKLARKPQDSQEWTPEYVGGLVGETFNGAWAIAEAHNAALAAAVDDFTRYHHNPIVADLNKQLAAEYDRGYEDCRALLKQEFAAERAKAKEGR
jgi:hypothetical protein